MFDIDTQKSYDYWLPNLRTGMEIIHTMVRWYKFNYGVGREMRAQGAEVMPCPYCGHDTAVYQSDYDPTGDPISFSVCLWCEGFIEYSGATTRPHEPYATVRDLQTDVR